MLTRLRFRKDYRVIVRYLSDKPSDGDGKSSEKQSKTASKEEKQADSSREKIQALLKSMMSEPLAKEAEYRANFASAPDVRRQPKKDEIEVKVEKIVYLSRAPNCFFLFARQSSETRLLSTCATGDNTSNKNIKQAQMSCSVQTVARFTAGDTVNLSQRDPNQILWLRPGNSYFGFVKLSS